MRDHWPAIRTMQMALLLGCSIWQVAAGATDKPIKLKKSDGSDVVVPATGELADERARAIASSLQSYDESSKHWRSAKPASPAAELREIADQARNESLDQLDLAYRMARKTSGGLDGDLLESAKKNIDFAKAALKRKPSESLLVRTQISTPPPQATLRYCSKGDRANPDCWQTYNTGSSLRIGRYVFRVESQGGGKAYEEMVWILEDPTEHTIVPRN
jgi:hypothetical protein